jgi:predicted esterase
MVFAKRIAVVLVLTSCGIWLGEPCLKAQAPESSQISANRTDNAQSDDSDLVLTRLRQKILSVLAQPQPPLFERHLRSVLAICEISALQVGLGGPREPGMRRELLGYLRSVEAGLNQDGYRPETYLRDGLRPLILARLSKTDDTLQFYLVDLPPHWDPNRAYPLLVQLHGWGPSLPAAYLTYGLSPHAPDAKPGPEGILLTPYLRGNHAWTESTDAEADLWEAIADLKLFAKTDTDRWYLSGHSAGGDATWAIVQRTPDLWAAAGMLAGSTYAAPVDLGLVSNMSYVPYYIWSGDQDLTQRLPSAEEARDALVIAGNPPMFVIAKGVAHMFRPEDIVQMSQWLLQHKRQRPDHFSFVIDTPRHRGVWGITIPRKYPYDQLVAEQRVKFECRIDNFKVFIQTWGDVQKLNVDLGPNGLQMSGNVTLVVNGKQEYEGAVPEKPLSLEFASRPIY